jgi:hypothetical protein
LNKVCQYIHKLEDTENSSKLVYGVKDEKMRKVLVIRTTDMIRNRSLFTYRIKLFRQGKQIMENILEHDTCFPIQTEYLDCQFQIRIDSEDEHSNWSDKFKIYTLIKQCQVGKRFFIKHGDTFIILKKEAGEFAETYDINFYSPMIIKNSLPCNLQV